MFNNTLFNCPMIMPMHEQMTRLYFAAKALRHVEGQSDVAKLLNESPQTLNNWEARGISKGGMLTAQEVIGCNAVWLRDGTGNMTSGQAAAPAKNVHQIRSPSNDIEIPQYKSACGGMGGGVILRDQPGEIHGWRVTPDWITKNVKNHTGVGNLAIVTGFGDSMRPLFNPGDPLLVDGGIKSVDFDSIYFFRIGEEGFIKRLQRVPGEGLIAISENKSYKDWAIKPEMDFEVFARVIKVWCGTDF